MNLLMWAPSWNAKMPKPAISLCRRENNFSVSLFRNASIIFNFTAITTTAKIPDLTLT